MRGEQWAVVVWCCVVVAVPVMFEVLWGYIDWSSGMIGSGIGSIVISLRPIWDGGPQCTFDRGQKPLVVTRRQQQVVQDLLVRLAFLEAATQCTVGASRRNVVSLFIRGFIRGFFPLRELPANSGLPYLDSPRRSFCSIVIKREDVGA